MLGKAEYGKFVLKSICEERIRFFLMNKIVPWSLKKAPKKAPSKNPNEDPSNNPCCKYGKFNDQNPAYVIETDTGDTLFPPAKPGLEQLAARIQSIFEAANGWGSGDLEEISQTLTKEERCYICRKIKTLSTGESLLGFISGEGSDYEGFIHNLACTAFGFKTDKGSDGNGYVNGSSMDYLTKGKCEIKESASKESASNAVLEGLKQDLKNKDVTQFLNENDWYQEFINNLPPEFRPLYRFAALVSDNIGKINKDKFDIKKIDGTAEQHVKQFAAKGKLEKFEKVPGEWHLQQIFIDEVQKLKDSL